MSASDRTGLLKTFPAFQQYAKSNEKTFERIFWIQKSIKFIFCQFTIKIRREIWIGCNFRQGISFHGPVNWGEAGGHSSKLKVVLVLIKWELNRQANNSPIFFLSTAKEECPRGVPKRCISLLAIFWCDFQHFQVSKTMINPLSPLPPWKLILPQCSTIILCCQYTRLGVFLLVGWLHYSWQSDC